MASQGVRLVGLVDSEPDGAGPRSVARDLGVPLVSSLAQLPQAPDLVSVAVPTNAHRQVAEPLLARGVHCLVEKPIAGSTRDARALVSAAERGGAHLQVGLVERFNPVMAVAGRLQEAPRYIEVHRLAPHTGRATDVGVVMDLMIHDLDLVNHLVGEEAVSVEAVGVTVVGPCEDVANARITYPSGCVANVTASRAAERPVRRLRLFSPGGYLSLDYGNREARLVRTPAPGWGESVAGLAARAVGLGGGRASGRPTPFEEALSTERLVLDDREPLRAEIEALVRTARGDASPHASGVEGLRALALAERVLGSIQSGRSHN